MYPYRAYLEALLSHGADAKDSQLTSALWFQDTAGQFNTMNGLNNGWQIRGKLAEESKSIDMMGRLHCDIFHQTRYLLNNVNVRIKLTRSKNAFNLLFNEVNPQFKPVIEGAYMLVRKVKVNDGIQLGHFKALEKKLALYPVRRAVTKYTLTIANTTCV